MASKRAAEFIKQQLDRRVRNNQYKDLHYYAFGTLEYIELKLNREIVAVQLFRDGAEEYTYWLTQEEREPIIAGMIKAGLKQSQIARLLKFSAGTISRDVRRIRLTTTLLDGVQGLRPMKITRTELKAVKRARDAAGQTGLRLH